MGLRLFNTLARSVREFIPLDAAGKNVGMYCCGPTVHDFAHIGNFRTFVFADLVRRYFEFKGYRVTQVMNITDVEDKIIKRVRESGAALGEYTGKHETAFLEDMVTLGCLSKHNLPRATGHIGEIISLIEKLIERCHAYNVTDGTVCINMDNYCDTGWL